MTGLRGSVGAALAALVLVAGLGLPGAGANPAPDGPGTEQEQIGEDERDGEDAGAGDSAGETDGSAPDTGAPGAGGGESDAGGETGGGADTSTPTRRPDTPKAPAAGRGDDDAAGQDRASDAERDDSAAAEPGALRVATGPIRITAPAGAGALLTAVMDVTVTDTRTDPAGWSVDVRAGKVRSTDGVVLNLGEQSYYRAGDTACSRSADTVPLTGAGVVAAVAAAACPHAGWTAELGIAVPADAPVGDYRLTITHSVY